MKERLEFVISQLDEVLSIDNTGIDISSDTYLKLTGIKGILIELLSVADNNHTVITLRNRIAMLTSDLDVNQKYIAELEANNEQLAMLNIDLDKEITRLLDEVNKQDEKLIELHQQMKLELLKSVLQHYDAADVLDVISVILKEKQ